MNEQIIEPDWNILINFGLPLSSRKDIDENYGYESVVQQIILAARYIIQKKQILPDGRYYDSFKALLLVLKTHYPSEFRRLEELSDINFDRSFGLHSLLGRHIKLRNISLNYISRYYREQGIFF
jgi:hypothetical protein